VKYVFDPQAKHNLVLGRETLVGKHRGKTLLIGGLVVCHLFVVGHFIVSGQTYKISRGSNNYFLHFIATWQM